MSKLEWQNTEGLFDYSIVVVDNDSTESARQTVESYARQSKIPISYYVEQEQNIALARNKTIENARGDFIALIDDDEFPTDQWLLTLYNALICFESDGMLGPVVPYFEKEPPKWVVKSRFFDRPAHRTGDMLGWKFTRTGNVLLKRELFEDSHEWFDPEFGSGGEDRDFFRRKINQGHVFLWCNEAPVFETVLPNRWKRSVVLKRALLRGGNAFNYPGSKTVLIINSLTAIVVYTVSLPLLLVMGQHRFMTYAVKIFDHLGKVLAFIGVKRVQEKYVGD